MASIEQLEAALQATWDEGTAAVYADALIERGDPRGEIIAIDLHVARRGATAELVAKRRERVSAWLGDADAKRYSVEDTRFGMISHQASIGGKHPGAARQITELVASRAWPYLRSLAISADSRRITATLALLAKHRLPWLRRLAIHHSTHRSTEPLGQETFDAFVAAAPGLRDLSLDGDGILGSPVHPNIETLRLVAAASLGVEDVATRHVIELDLSFGQNHRLRALASLLHLQRWPALERLDLSRNEGADALEFVYALDELDHLAQLRLPSLRSDADAENARQLLERHPRLEITIAKMYGYAVPDRLRHPRLRVPASRPWPPRDQMSHREALSVALFYEPIRLSPCVELLEAQFDAMSLDAQAAWTALWRFLDDNQWHDELELPFDAATLLRALEAIDASVWLWAQVAVQLRAANLPPGATVMLYRHDL